MINPTVRVWLYGRLWFHLQSFTSVRFMLRLGHGYRLKSSVENTAGDGWTVLFYALLLLEPLGWLSTCSPLSR